MNASRWSWPRHLARRAALSLLALGLAACGASAPRPAAGPLDVPPGLVSCRDGREPAEIDPDRPLALLVHGCNSSAGRFVALAEVFEAHDQQAVCFEYDDRSSLDESAAGLTAAIGWIAERLRSHQLTVLGHSQGGLISRRALTRGELSAARTGLDVRLVTVSAPFAGIAASRDCGRVWMHVLTLGVATIACYAIAGAKWDEIPPQSEFIRVPGDLVRGVTRHLAVVTDERGTCRTEDGRGNCVVDDYVFTLAEQRPATVAADGRTAEVEVRAGHVEIVGDQDLAPRKLIAILQQEGVLAPTPPERRAAIALLLARLF